MVAVPQQKKEEMKAKVEEQAAKVCGVYVCMYVGGLGVCVYRWGCV